MPIDEQTRQALDFINRMSPLGAEPNIVALRQMERNRPARPPAPERALLAEVRDDVIEADGRRIPIRIYTPKPADRLGEQPPVLLYFHGGGHTTGARRRTSSRLRRKTAMPRLYGWPIVRPLSAQTLRVS